MNILSKLAWWSLNVVTKKCKGLKKILDIFLEFKKVLHSMRHIIDVRVFTVLLLFYNILAYENNTQLNTLHILLLTFVILYQSFVNLQTCALRVQVKWISCFKL